MLIMRLWTLDWGYDHLRLRLWSLHWRRKIIPKPARPCSTCPFFYEISGTSWFFFFSGVIIASVEGDHSPSKVFIASWSTLFMHEILCMKMIIAMNCCCSCMIFWIMAMKDYWSWMISTDRCIISWPLISQSQVQVDVTKVSFEQSANSLHTSHEYSRDHDQ